MAFEDCIKRAHDDGEIDDETARYLYQKYREDSIRLGRSGAQRYISEYLDKAGEHTRRMKVLQIQKFLARKKEIYEYKGPHGEHDIIDGFKNLFENQGFGGMTSLRSYREGLISMLNGEMADFLHHFERSAVMGRRNDRQQQATERGIVRAAFGLKNISPRELGFYGSVSKVFESLRQMRNERGGNTAKLENWGLPQYHNPEAVNRGFASRAPTIQRGDRAAREGRVRSDMAEARDGWVKYINDNVDFSKQFDNVTGELFPPNMSRAEQDRISAANWVNIGTDGWLSDPEHGNFGGSALGRQRQDHRFYVFKGPDEWMNYNRQFGAGSVFQAIMHHFHGMASEVSLMQMFGPNPGANIAALKTVIKKEGDEFIEGRPAFLKLKTGMFSGGVNHKNLVAHLKQEFQTIDGYHEQYTGVGPKPNALALTGTITRNWVGSALMGKAIIPHLATNPYIQYKVRTIAGIPAARTIPSILRSYSNSSRAEMLRAGVNLEAGIGDLNAGASQLSALQKVTNLSHWLPDRTVHLTGLARTLDAIKGAFYRDAFARLGDQQHLSWADMNKDFRARLAGHGVREQDWRIIQLATPYIPVPGSAPWLRANDVQKVGTERPNDVLDIVGRSPRREGLNFDPNENTLRDLDRARRAAFMAAWRLNAYMQGEREVMVPTKSMRAQSWLYGKTDANTISGQILRSFGQFKGFIGSFMVSQAAITRNQMARGKSYGIAYAAAGAIALLMLQMLSMQMKQGANFRDFLPMNPLYRSGIMTWLRAFFSSLTFGYGGESLVADESSYGQGWAESMLGPEAELLAGTAFDLLSEVRKRNAATRDSHEPFSTWLAKQGLKTAAQATPLASTAWYGSAAFHRMVLDQARFAVDRDAQHAFRMQEDRQQNATGVHFAWPPGDMFPRRLSQFTPSR